MKVKTLFVFGTRPEAIKVAPLIKQLNKSTIFEIKVCVTGQHRKMLDQVLDFFSIQPEFDLQLMTPGQTLADITANAVKGLDTIFSTGYTPDYVVVQGDTTTAFAGALAAFYAKSKVIHLEAGLRSFDNYSPYPEEMNRQLVSKLATIHLAPTSRAVDNLLSEGVKADAIWNVGNTVIDALLLGLKTIRNNGAAGYDNYFNFLDRTKKIILVTGHRRENFGEPFENICHALKIIAEKNPDVEIIYPMHLNPNVREPVSRILKNQPGIHLIEPLDYPHLIWLLNMSTIVITDSGGIQEEAPALGKPVLVMRDVTERMEGIEAGTAKLVGTDITKITTECQTLLDNQAEYRKMSKAINPYGDGTSCQKIQEILENHILLNHVIKTSNPLAPLKANQ